MAVDFSTIDELLRLEPHGPDTFVGDSPEYPWGRVYGGQVVAQALRAATLTVPDERPVHSLHAYFIRGGDSHEPIRFEVDRTRNGRSFVTRRVAARQSGGVILDLVASFHAPEPEADVQTVGPPGDLPGSDEGVVTPAWTRLIERQQIDLGPRPERAAAWLRVAPRIGSDPSLHACALAYLSDDVPMDAIQATHPRHPAPDGVDVWMGASLDHSMFFHRPVDANRWHLFDLRSHGLIGGRGLAVGEVFDADGTHVATVTQQGLLRERR